MKGGKKTSLSPSKVSGKRVQEASRDMQSRTENAGQCLAVICSQEQPKIMSVVSAAQEQQPKINRTELLLNGRLGMGPMVVADKKTATVVQKTTTTKVGLQKNEVSGTEFIQMFASQSHDSSRGTALASTSANIGNGWGLLSGTSGTLKSGTSGPSGTTALGGKTVDNCSLISTSWGNGASSGNIKGIWK